MATSGASHPEGGAQTSGEQKNTPEGDGGDDHEADEADLALKPTDQSAPEDCVDGEVRGENRADHRPTDDANVPSVPHSSAPRPREPPPPPRLPSPAVSSPLDPHCKNRANDEKTEADPNERAPRDE